ncbi:MAG TPA: hypothetical protein VFO14_08050 [Vicinamibacterales bacterium]|nr:hypothetical protein [Vicinamibacterales bacterium]
MRQAMLGFCVFAAACSSQPFSPAGPSRVAGAAGTQTQANSGAPNVEVTFTKWVPAFPTLAGVTGGDVPGTFAGTVLSRDPFENGNIVQLEARYEVIDPAGVHSFVAHISGKQNNQTQEAVFNGTITEGWLVGAQVHVTYDVIRPCPEFGQSVCFTGVIRVMSGSAD